MPEMPQALESDLRKGVVYHLWWGRFDFLVSQLILWTGIVSSFLSALVAAGTVEFETKWLGPAIAALPGALILIDRSFKYGARSAWHSMYRVRLRGLILQLRDANAQRKEVA